MGIYDKYKKIVLPLTSVKTQVTTALPGVIGRTVTTGLGNEGIDLAIWINEKLQDNTIEIPGLAELIQLTGMPEGSTTLGSFNGNIIPDNSTIKQALQILETAVMGAGGGSGLNGIYTGSGDIASNVVANVTDSFSINTGVSDFVKIGDINGVLSNDFNSINGIGLEINSQGYAKLGKVFSQTGYAPSLYISKEELSLVHDYNNHLTFTSTEFPVLKTDKTQFNIWGAYNNFKGLVYKADYSNNYVDRSLVDKAYVDLKSQIVADGDKGDITISNNGTVWLVNNSVLTYNKLQNTTGSKLLGRYDSTTGTIQEIALGTGLAFVNNTLVSTGGSGGILLTTNNSSGPATLNSGTLNIPNYSLTGLGGVPTTRTITINGETYDLSQNRSWNITSMIYPSAGIPISTGTGWGTSIVNNSTNWNTAYSWGNHATQGYLTSVNLNALTDVTIGTLNNGQILQYNGTTSQWENKTLNFQTPLTLTTNGTSGAATLAGDGTLNIPNYSTAPGGSNTQVQFNNSGVFEGSSKFTWSNDILSLNTLTSPVSPILQLSSYFSASGNNGKIGTRIYNVGQDLAPNRSMTTLNFDVASEPMTNWQTAMSLVSEFDINDNLQNVTLSVNGGLSLTNIPLITTDATNVLGVSTNGGLGKLSLDSSTLSLSSAGVLSGVIKTLNDLTDVVVSSPTSGQVLSYDGTNWVNTTGGGITSLNGLTASTQTFATGTTGTDFNISSATSTHTFNLPTASATNRGLLSSANWTTFNNKIGGTGAANKVAFFTDAGTLSNNTNFHWDNTNSRLGLGTSSPNNRLHVVGSSNTSGSTSFLVQNSTPSDLFKITDDGRTTMNFATVNESLTVLKNNASTEIVRFARNANRRLIYNTDGYLSLFSDTGGISGGGDFFNAWIYGNFKMDAPSFTTQSSMALAGNIIPTAGNALFNGILLSHVVNQTGGASGTTRGLHVNPTLTSAFDWRSIEWSNNTGYGLYGAGTANNYLGGNTVIGTTTPSARLHVRGSDDLSTSSALLVQNNATTPANLLDIRNNGNTVIGTGFNWINSSGRLGIGTASPAQLLHVAGVTRIDGTNTIVDNRDNAFLTQSASTVTSNRESVWGNGQYAKLRAHTKGFYVGASFPSENYLLYADGGIGSGTLNREGIYLRPTQPAAGGNTNGGDVIIELPAGTGTGRRGAVLIGTATATGSSAIMEISSTNQGLLLPRMTGAQAEAIPTPADGLLVYANNGNGAVITSVGFWGYSAGAWSKLN